MADIKCIKCGETKPASLFYKSPKNKNGRASSCAECVKEYTRARSKSIVKQLRYPVSTVIIEHRNGGAVSTPKPLSRFYMTNVSHSISNGCSVISEDSLFLQPENTPKRIRKHYDKIQLVDLGVQSRRLQNMRDELRVPTITEIDQELADN